jgi:hypothetical protein
LRDAQKAIDFFFEQLQSAVVLEPKDVVFLVNGSLETIYEPTTNHPLDDAKARADNYFIFKAMELNYNIIELFPIFRNHYYKFSQRFDYPTDAHWNELAHELVFNTILFSRHISNFDDFYGHSVINQY